MRRSLAAAVENLAERVGFVRLRASGTSFATR
jgi:hypothetical protein